MACHRCPVCGYQYCDLDVCPQCSGIKKSVQQAKLKKAMEELGRNDAGDITSSVIVNTDRSFDSHNTDETGHSTDGDYKNYLRDI